MFCVMVWCKAIWFRVGCTKVGVVFTCLSVCARMSVSHVCYDAWYVTILGEEGIHDMDCDIWEWHNEKEKKK